MGRWAVAENQLRTALEKRIEARAGVIIQRYQMMCQEVFSGLEFAKMGVHWDGFTGFSKQEGHARFCK